MRVTDTKFSDRNAAVHQQILNLLDSNGKAGATLTEAQRTLLEERAKDLAAKPMCEICENRDELMDPGWTPEQCWDMFEHQMQVIGPELNYTEKMILSGLRLASLTLKGPLNLSALEGRCVIAQMYEKMVFWALCGMTDRTAGMLGGTINHALSLWGFFEDIRKEVKETIH